MKQTLLSLLLLILLTSCGNDSLQNKCREDQMKALNDLGAEIYYIEHHPDERLATKDDSATLDLHKRQYEIIFLYNCPEEK